MPRRKTHKILAKETLDQWIQNGFVHSVESKYLKNEYFYPLEEILSQLLLLKRNKNRSHLDFFFLLIFIKIITMKAM